MPSAFENQTLALVDQAINQAAAEEMPRGHLGMSSIADDARALWLKFRWSLPDDPEPRVRRIFRLGHVIESEVVELLRLAGLTVHADDGSAQFGFKALGGHYAGSMDGAVVGLPESTQWHVLEVKSVKDARFASLEVSGVQEWDSNYYGQMQCYMHHSGMKRALFVAYNKDTSALYFERVKYDPLYGPAMIEKARSIISEPIPESTYANRDWYEIKNYKSDHYQAVYWGDELPPKPNCRNCRFAVAATNDNETGAAWGCMKWRRELTLENQVAGCLEHNWIPDLVPLQVITDGTGDSMSYVLPSGAEVRNGPNDYSSAEFVQLSRVGFAPNYLNDEFIQGMRETFGARIESLGAEAGPTF